MKNKVKIDLDSLIKFLPGHVYWLDTNMVFFGCNEEQAISFGLSLPLEIVGKTPYDFVSKEIADTVIANNKLVLKNKKTLTFEEATISSNGTKRIFLSKKTPLFDDLGKVIGLLGISFDITEQKNKEESTDILLEKIISHMPGNIYWKNRQGVYLGCNENQVKLLKLASSQEIIGKKLADLFPDKPEIVKNISLIDEEIMNKNEEKTFEEPGVNIHRQSAVYLTSKVPLHDQDGNVSGLLGLSFDISERKQIEENLRIAKDKAEAANLLKTEFIRNMEHDIRTPYSGIYAITKNLAEKETDKKKKSLLLDVSNAAKELLDYANSILDFSKIESDSIPILAKKFNIKETIEGVINMETPAAINKKLKLKFNYSKNISTIVIGDEYRLKRILVNLISNSIKFTKKGYVNIKVESVKNDNKCIVLRLFIEDTGIGIPKEKQYFIYEKFVRATPANQGIYKGFGLGLRIVKQFITEMEGEIDVKSEENKGTIFICTLPFILPLVDEVINEFAS